MNYSQFRINYGLHWKRRYPTPGDYKRQSRFVMALMLILFMLWLAAGMLDYQSELVQVKINNEPAQLVATACLNQAVQADRYGKQMHVGWVADGMLIGVDCTVYSREAHKNVGRMM